MKTTFTDNPMAARAAAVTPTRSAALSLIEPLYAALTTTDVAQIRPLLESVTQADWCSCTGPDRCETREQTIERWSGRLEAVPRFELTADEIILAEDRIVVRGQAAGTPAGQFMGLATQGRSFRIMTLDIHLVSEGLIARTYHLEDWARALRQLTGAE